MKVLRLVGRERPHRSCEGLVCRAVYRLVREFAITNCQDEKCGLEPFLEVATQCQIVPVSLTARRRASSR